MIADIKQALCSLFEVEEDEGVIYVKTPLTYPVSGDAVVVRARPHGDGFDLDDNGEAALALSLAGIDPGSEAVIGWAASLSGSLTYDSDEETLHAGPARNALEIGVLAIRIAEAARALQEIAAMKTERTRSDFKERIVGILREVEAETGVRAEYDARLDLAGGLTVDAAFQSATPLYVVAATTPVRLLEAELIHTQMQLHSRPAFVLAVVDNVKSVGRVQFDRANYYTGKTVLFEGMHRDFAGLVARQVAPSSVVRH